MTPPDVKQDSHDGISGRTSEKPGQVFSPGKLLDDYYFQAEESDSCRRWRQKESIPAALINTAISWSREMAEPEPWGSASSGNLGIEADEVLNKAGAAMSGAPLTGIVIGFFFGAAMCELMPEIEKRTQVAEDREEPSKNSLMSIHWYR